VIAPPPAINDGDPPTTIGENGAAAAVWLQVGEPVAREQAIDAQALTPGATSIQIAVHRAPTPLT
jgi:hypothetical protein